MYDSGSLFLFSGRENVTRKIWKFIINSVLSVATVLIVE